MLARYLPRALIVLALAGLAALYVADRRAGAPLRPPARAGLAPDFTLADLAGRQVTLSSLRGRPVLVNFFATWCPPCRAELPELQQLWTDKPGCLAVLGVVLDSGDASTVAQFARERGLGYPLLMDDGTAGVAYRVAGIPHSVLIDPEGRLVGTFEGALTARTVASLVERAPGRC